MDVLLALGHNALDALDEGREPAVSDQPVVPIKGLEGLTVQGAGGRRPWGGKPLGDARIEKRHRQVGEHRQRHGEDAGTDDRGDEVRRLAGLSYWYQ